MLNSDKLYKSSSYIVTGILFLCIGIIILVGKSTLYFNFVSLFVIGIFLSSFIQFIQFFFLDKQKRIEKNITFTRCCLNLFFGIILLRFPRIPVSILPILFSIYLLGNSLVKLITYILLKAEKAQGRMKEIILFLIYFLLGISLLISPLKNIFTMLSIMGSYFILLGMNHIFDFINTIIPNKTKKKLKRKVRITLPVWLEAIIPYRVLNEINYYLREEKAQENAFVFQRKKKKEIPDMEIFIHSSMNGFNRIGHVDICYKDTVISYGNYDSNSMKFFETIGDGVVFVTSKNKYIPFCINHSLKTIISFGMKLNEEQNKQIKNYIHQLFQNMVKWKPHAQIASENGENIDTEPYKDYASCLYKATKAKFYKFKKGKFKKYFVLGSNCCLLADSIIGKSGTDILKMNGIITPGTYYEYLNREFNKKNSMVITKTIYNKKSTQFDDSI